MTPRQLSLELRKGQSPDLNRRRWIIGLSMVGAAAAKIVLLYQTGIIHQLPDPPVGPFDSARVDASDYAYKRFNAPDGPAMLASYAVTAWLASAGGKERADESPLIPIAMGVKILGDVVTALELGREEWQENKALCAYCQAATIASIASLALAAPEVSRAVQKLRGQKTPVERIAERARD